MYAPIGDLSTFPNQTCRCVFLHQNVVQSVVSCQLRSVHTCQVPGTSHLRVGILYCKTKANSAHINILTAVHPLPNLSCNPTRSAQRVVRPPPVSYSPIDVRIDDRKRWMDAFGWEGANFYYCLLYTSPSPRDATLSRMPSSA